MFAFRDRFRWSRRARQRSSTLTDYNSRQDEQPWLNDGASRPRHRSDYESQQRFRPSETGYARHDVEDDQSADYPSNMEPQIEIGENGTERQDSISLASNNDHVTTSQKERHPDEPQSPDHSLFLSVDPGSPLDLAPTPGSQHPSRPRRLSRSLGLERWWTFVSRHEKLIEKRVNLGDARRDYINNCNDLGTQLNYLASLLQRARQEGFQGLDDELLQQSDLMSTALGNINLLASQQDTAEEILLEEENALAETAPTVFDRRGDTTLDLLQRHGLDFPGPVPSAGESSSVGLPNVRDDVAPEVENYYSRLREVDQLEDQLLRFKHERTRHSADTEDFSEDMSENENTYVLLSDAPIKQSLVEQLHRARFDLLVAKTNLASTTELESTILVAGEGPIVDEFAMKDALRSPMQQSNAYSTPVPANSPHQAVSPTTQGEPSEPAPWNPGFMQNWLTEQVAQSEDKLTQLPEHLQHQLNSRPSFVTPSRSLPLPQTRQRILEPEFRSLFETTLQSMTRTTPINTPSPAVFDQMEQELDLGHRDRIRLDDFEAANVHQRSRTEQSGTRSLPGTRWNNVSRTPSLVADDTTQLDRKPAKSQN